MEPATTEQVVDEIVAEEVFEPPRHFVCSESFPSEATVAVRLEPNKASSLVTSLPHGAEVMATAARGTYLQFRFESPENGSQLVWVPRVLDGLVLFVEKLDLPKEREVEGGSTEEAIHEQQEQIERCQSWWAWQGATAAASHPMLSVVDASVLGEVIAAGANYHNCLSADRLDTLQRNVSKSSLPGLEPLKRALQSKGGAKSQARAVGSVIFKEAMEVFKNPPSEANKSTAETEIEAQAVQPEDKPRSAIVADEVFEPPRRFVCSESFPSEATVAVRLEPNKASSLVTSLPHGAEVMATAARGTYLQFRFESPENGSQLVWVPRVLDGLVLFVEKLDLPKEREVEGGSTEEAIHEQQEQIERCQSWWAWQGATAAASHPMLSVVDASVLGEVIAAGANYHNCLSADRLDTLQRNVSKSSLPGLEPLKRALQSKGGAKSQARAVGSVIFKEAMEVFKNPSSEANKSTAETEIEAQAVQPEDKPRSAIVADEVFEPPRRFVCSESFPSEATVAVRLEPNKASSLVTSLPHGAEVMATAARGTYLQFRFESPENGSQLVWVPRVLDGLVLFVEKLDLPKEREVEGGSTEEAIHEQQEQIERCQSWWAWQGATAAASHPMLSVVDASVLGEVIAAGANYHNCLSADRLDTLQRNVSKSSLPGLEPLKRALQSKGGAKSQARAVGSVIFKEAMEVFKNPSSEANKSTAETEIEAQAVQPEDKPRSAIVADEVFEPPRRFVCSEFFPSEATVAVRLEPNKASSLVTSLPHGAEVMATAARGTYLQFRFESPENGSQLVWVPRVLDGLVLFVEKLDLPKEREVEGGSTEEAIHEQQEQIERCQSWWAWQGATAAASHPMLSVVDASVLGEVIAAGANYHNCLSADRLDTLQRNVSKSSLPGLEPLKRALQSKGGAKSQARAVGSVIFKEAMEVFKNPPSEANKSTAETEIEAQAVQPEDKPRSAIVADEVFEPPRRFVCSESFPSDPRLEFCPLLHVA